MSIARRLSWTGLISLFVAPYFFAFFIAKGSLRLPDGFADLALYSITQAALSALLALLFGFFGAFFLVRVSALKNRASGLWEGIALLPSVAPASAIVLGMMEIAPSWRGWSAVVFAHALTSSGLIAVAISRTVLSKLGASLELAWTEGASGKMLWMRGVLPAIRRDLLRLGITVFAACMASFSIPLLLGGAKAVTLEIAIHQAIRLENAWDVAASLSIFQFVFLFGAMAFLGRVEEPSKTIESDSRAGLGRFLGSRVGMPFVAVGSTVILFSVLRGPILGWTQLETAGLFEDKSNLLLALYGGLATSTLAGLLTAILLLAFARTFPSQKLRVWMSGYAAPSVAVTGFTMLFVGWQNAPSLNLDIIRVSLGAALVFAPVLWRLRWERRLSELEGQIQVARTLGASDGMIFRRILMPQVSETTFWSAGLVSFWMWGDYAIGSVAASRTMTLGMLAKSLMESYRLEAASLLVLLTLILGAVSYRLFSWGGVRVAR